MQEAVEEGVESEHPAKLDEPLHARQFAKRRDGERDEQEDERQHACSSRQKFYWIGSELLLIPVPSHQREWYEAVDEDEDFVKLDFFHRVSSRLEVDSQIHPRIQLPDLFRVAVEHQSVALAIFADARLACLTPSRVVNVWVNVRVKTVFA